MKYEVKYTMQHIITVIVNINDRDIIEDVAKLGDINSDKDFQNESDPRWKIEQVAFEKMSSYDEDVQEGIDSEGIVDRSIKRV